MMNREKGLDEGIRVAERLLWNLDFMTRDCRDVEVFVCRVVGDRPGSVEDGAKGYWMLWMLAEPHNP